MISLFLYLETFLNCYLHILLYLCRKVIRVFAPFTADHYRDKGERPNTGLAENSSFINRDITRHIENKDIN